LLNSAHPEMVDFGSEQGLNDFESDGATVIVTTRIACYFEDLKPPRSKLREIFQVRILDYSYSAR